MMSGRTSRYTVHLQSSTCTYTKTEVKDTTNMYTTQCCYILGSGIGWVLTLLLLLYYDFISHQLTYRLTRQEARFWYVTTIRNKKDHHSILEHNPESISDPISPERKRRAAGEGHKKGGKRGRWAENARTPVKVVPLDRVLHNFPRLIG